MSENTTQIPETSEQALQVLHNRPLIHNGAHVMPLLAVDAIHDREPGSIARHFDRYKDKALQKGMHYVEVPYVEWSQWVSGTPSEGVPAFLPVISGGGGHRGPLIMLTERGYLRLIMYFEDELSRVICEHVLDVYFNQRANQQQQEQMIEQTLGYAYQAMRTAGETALALSAALPRLDARVLDIIKRQNATFDLLRDNHDVVQRAINDVPITIANRFSELLDEKLPTAMVAASEFVRASPRTHYGPHDVPATFPRPHDLPYEDLRSWHREFIKWLEARWEMTRHESYIWAHNISSEDMQFNVEYNYRGTMRSYFYIYDCESRITMLYFLGRLRHECISLWDHVGNGQRPCQAHPCDKWRSLNLVPIGEREGMSAGVLRLRPIGQRNVGRRRHSAAVEEKMNTATAATTKHKEQRKRASGLKDRVAVEQTDNVSTMPHADVAKTRLEKEKTKEKVVVKVTPEPFHQAQQK